MDEQDEGSNLGLLGGITGLVALFMVMSLLCVIVSGVVLYSMANVPATTEAVEEQPAVEGESGAEASSEEVPADNAEENTSESGAEDSNSDETESHDSSWLPALILTI